MVLSKKYLQVKNIALHLLKVLLNLGKIDYTLCFL